MRIFDLFRNKKIDISTKIVQNNYEKLEFNENIDALTQVFNAYSFYGE